MKYLKPPMLSMNFSENKEGMKKRISNILTNTKKHSGKICLGVIILCIAVVGCFVACNQNDNTIIDDTVRKMYPVDLESATSLAILNNNTGKYLSGETTAEGHIILDTITEAEKVYVYALTTYGEYGFENGIFTKVSGTGVIPTKITFEKKDSGYYLVEYKEPKDGNLYAESIKEMFPDNLEKRAMNYTDWDAEKCHQQEYQYANQYLTTIGRDAEVSFKVEHKLADMNVTASNMFIDLYHDYPYWIGTQEKIEHNVRYVYEKLWEDKGKGDGIVTFKKYKYDNNAVVEEYVIEVKGDTIIYLKGEERTTRAQNSIAKEVELGKGINVDLDGDGIKENIFYSLADFKINDISYKNDIQDVYLDNPDRVTYIIADIDKKDNQKEIILKVEGPSDDPAAHIYTYNKGLVMLGKAETALNYTSFDGEGNFYGDVRLDVLQTWFAPESWSLRDNKIIRNTGHIYYPNQYIANEIVLKEELPVYELIDSKEMTTIKPQRVRITRTDNKEKCYIEAEDGTTGWFKVTEFFRLVDLDNKIATDVFDGLCMAD